MYAFPDAAAAHAAYATGDPLYARDGLPNVRSLEQAVADLEGAEAALAVSSGMAAMTVAFLTLLRSGDQVVAPACGYCDTGHLLQEILGRFGVGVRLVDMSCLAEVEAAIDQRTRIVFAETISNPGMVLADVPALADIAHRAGALLIVDNTLATPVFCRPLAHGADLVLHSAGKFLGGHGDVMAGVIAGSAHLITDMKLVAYLTGPVLAPVDAWLTLRGIRTLAPRMSWTAATTATIAAFLASHPAVAEVRYAGQPPPDRTRLTRDLLPLGAGCVLAFTLAGGPAAADRFIAALQTIPYVPTIGGTTTIVSFPPRLPEFTPTGDRTGEPYQSDVVRLSIGLEDPAELLTDVEQALIAAATRSTDHEPVPHQSADGILNAGAAQGHGDGS